MTEPSRRSKRRIRMLLRRLQFYGPIVRASRLGQLATRCFIDDAGYVHD